MEKTQTVKNSRINSIGILGILMALSAIMFAPSAFGSSLMPDARCLVPSAVNEGSDMASVPPAKGAPAPVSESASGVDGRDLPTVRNGLSLATEQEIVRLYEGIATSTNQRLAKAIADVAAAPDSASAVFARNRAAGVLRAIDEDMARLRITSEQVQDAAARTAVELGAEQGQRHIRELGTAAGADRRLGFGDTGIQAGLIETIARDTVARTMSAADQHANGVRSTLRSLAEGSLLAGREGEVNRAIAEGLVSGDPRIAERSIRLMFAEDPAEAERFRRLSSKIITVGGWTGKVSTYTATVTRTRMREASEQARHNEYTSAGVNLVQITGANSKNFCTDFLGLVCWIGSVPVAGYPALRDLPGGGPPFHPNCSKSTVAYIPDLVSDERRAAAEKAAGALTQARRG